jgi:tight adherence protein B
MRSALFDSDWGTLALGVAVGCLVLTAALVALARPRGAWLRGRIDPYGRLDMAGSATAALDARPGWQPSAERLYGETARRLEGTRLWQRTMRLLERGGSQLRPAEFLWRCALFALAAGVLVAIATGSLGLGVVAVPVALALPWAWMKRAARRRLRRFEEQLPDVLLAIAGSLKVGVSFTHSLSSVVESTEAPASEEFERVLNEAELGRPMEDSLAALADRIESEDLRFVLMSVAIQREVGGSLADLFALVSETVRERQHFRRKVRALTAMGRTSAQILVAIPFVIVGAVSALSPGYISPLFHTGVGVTLIVVMLVMMAVGAMFLKKIVTIKG